LETFWVFWRPRGARPGEFAGSSGAGFNQRLQRAG